MLDTLLEEWRLWQQSQALSDRTIRERANTIRHLITYTGADPIHLQPRDIIRYCAKPGLTPVSRATYHASIRAYCLWLIRADYRDDNPALKTPTPKRPKGQPRPITDDQLDAMLNAANRRRTRTYILLGALAGLRVHEIAKLHGSDIAGDTITVTGKGNRTAIIPLHPVLQAVAAQYPPRGYWFPPYTGTDDHVSSHAVSKAIHDAMQRAGFDGHPHQLRHWYGTTLVSRGVDLGVVQKLMRHVSPATTVIYADVRFGLQSAGLAKLDLPHVA